MQLVQLEAPDGKKWEINPLAVKYAFEESESVELVFLSGKTINVLGSWDEVRNKIWPL